MTPKNNTVIRTLFLFGFAILIGSCGLIQETFSSKDGDEDYPRAFFIDKEVSRTATSDFVRVRANLDEVARLVSGVMEEVTDTTVNVLRVPDGQMVRGNMQAYMRITTPLLKTDSIAYFREYFNVGEYLLDQEDFYVKPENMSYRVQAIIYLRGQDFIVDFSLNGSLDWNLYQKGSRSDRKISRDDRVKYAVGSYRYKQPVERVNWRGNTYETFEWVVIDINDAPVTRGDMEKKLTKRLIEQAAIDNFTAGIINRY